jgi:DeoR family transcriptional regulator, fructose operon transcriptional repressor
VLTEKQLNATIYKEIQPHSSQAPREVLVCERNSPVSELVAPGLLAAERRQELLGILAAQAKIDVSWAAKKLGTSHETIRKDLVALESQGLLKRVHGGALPVTTVTFEEGVDERTQNQEEKYRIAQRAISEVPTGGAIFIDSGSTTRFFADMLPANPQLMVFTNSLPVAQALLSKPSIPFHLVGGRVRSVSQATVGSWAQNALEEIHVDVAFVGTNALSLHRGLSTPDADEAAIKSRMIQMATRTVLMIDHSKFDQDALFSYSPLSNVDLLITGSETPADVVDNYEKAGVEVVVA